MHPILRNFLRMNWVLFGLMIALLIYGVYAIHSATWMRDQHFAKSQATWIFVCLPMFFVVSLMDYRWVRFGAIPLYVLSILTLIATMFLGEKRYGARSWLNLGPASFQPSQLAVIAGIMTIALFLSRTRTMPAFLRILCCGAIVGAPWLMILIQPDLGSCIVWVPVILGMMFVGYIPKRWLILMLVIAFALIPLVVHFGLKPYQYSRITTFLNPEADPQGDGWNITQSLIAIGSGGLVGKGYKAPNTQNALGFLPATIVHNDFIFSVMGEQHGFLGGVILIAALTILFVVMLGIAIEAEDDLGRLLAIGITLLLFTHTFMNLGMTISLTPITGLPLPLVSYGGSFIMITLLSFGLLQSIWIYRRSPR
ncbi:rod shape-determining protein RodA [bacterium]|nr:rod shape-determining protein RodA [bacterium]NBS52338.1 rod shape-determining protein RodA [Spartobacteria bacterium]